MKVPSASDVPAPREGDASPPPASPTLRPDAPSSGAFPPSGAGPFSGASPSSGTSSTRFGASSRPSARLAAPPVTAAHPRPAPATLDFALLRGALEEIPFGVATTRGGAVLYANEALSRIYGAAQGGMDQRQVSELFDAPTYRTIARVLEEKRVFDGRVRTRAFDGREIDAEVHVEQYSSEAQGVGGFVVVRDVSLELGALGRLVDQLGGALFRFRLGDGALEQVSGAIAKLTGLDVAKCTQRPVLLTTLVSTEERERLTFLFRRLARGELAVADAQVSVRRLDGITRLLHVRATGRRDTAGVVRHIDGVVVDAGREADLHRVARESARPASPTRGDGPDPAAPATMELSYELLREASQNLNVLARELRSTRAALKAASGAMPADVAADLTARLEVLASAAASATALNRGVRHALAHASIGAPLAEVLETVRVTLAPLVGEQELAIDAGDAGDVIIVERADELTLALTHLALRAFRFAGSGTLRLTVRREPGSASSRRGASLVPGPVIGPAPGPDSRPSRPGSARAGLLIEVVSHAPADLVGGADDISSDMLRTIPRPDEANLAYGAAQALLHCAGGAIESDDATFVVARTVIRLQL